MDQDNMSSGGIPPSPPGIGAGAPVVPVRRWDPRGKRNLIIIGCVVLGAAVLLVLLFTMGGGKRDEGRPSAATTTNGGQPVQNGMLSQSDRAALQQAEDARIEEAKKRGQSMVANDIGPSSATLVTGQPGTPGNMQGRRPGEMASSEVRLNQNSQVQSASPPPQIDEKKLAGLQDQMSRMMVSWGMASGEGGQQRKMSEYVREAPPKTQANAGAQTNPQGQQANSAGNNTPKDEDDAVVITPYAESYAAETMGFIDTDGLGKLRAQILSGPLTGAVVRGTAKRIGTTGVQFEFTEASYKGRQIKVSAYGVDINDSGDVVRGKYDGRYMERYVFPVFAEGVKAYANARAQTGTQVVAIAIPSTSGAGIVSGAQQTPPPSAEQARDAMYAAGAGQVSQALKSGPQDGHITLEVRTPFGIVFEQPVFQSDISGPVRKTAK